MANEFSERVAKKEVLSVKIFIKYKTRIHSQSGKVKLCRVLPAAVAGTVTSLHSTENGKLWPEN